MDLKQNKLTKAEWDSIEIQVGPEEKKILKLIHNGYENVNIRVNETLSLNSYIHFPQTTEMDYFLYKKYFEDTMMNVMKKYGDESLNEYTCTINSGKLKKLKSGETIRLNNLDNTIQLNKSRIFEYLLIDLFIELVKQIKKRKHKYAFYLYTLIQLKKASIKYVNVYVNELLDYTINYVNSFTKTSEIITNAYDFIECNKYLLKYEDRQLFQHQKQLFTICKNREEFVPKLILYTAPTGTGKTLSPIGLSTNNRIIFVCVARHIGLALAKSAISMEKKVAFAFGCETSVDIRLHYFAAIDYTINRRSGGIGKVDNSVGDNVEIMICDVQSYITAMHYMLAFNPAENIITYWDEPTITLDYETHELHQTINKNWSENQIPTMVLSCATLPSQDDLQPIFDDFINKFDNAEIHRISSYDCRKSIPILDTNGFCVLPHYLYEEYNEMISSAVYCKENKTILRYFDLREIISFIEYVNIEKYIDERYTIDTYFEDKVQNITMNSLKEYYLEALLHINSENWVDIYDYMSKNRKPRYNEPRSNVYIQTITKPPVGVSITTTDAYTLTDGPTIFLANDVDKIAKFYIKNTNISNTVYSDILKNIDYNNTVTDRINKLEKEIETQEEKEGKTKTKGKDNNYKMSNEIRKLVNETDKLRKKVKLVSLESVYLPNTRLHQNRWTPNGIVRENAFISNIGEEMSKEIMLLDIDDHLKFLLLLGIGVFKQIENKRYMEIIKQLADEQRLYIIIASTDYIYGTNYQFCHGFIGKDLNNMTQQKTLQAMGRVGRNNIQQDYTIRFRDNNMIMKLFKTPEHNVEAINMRKLFVSQR
tara:strand:- start:664 stop:3129 length:2466 start_codon:yes stop_codon:yes gene_type:complete